MECVLLTQFVSLDHTTGGSEKTYKIVGHKIPLFTVMPFKSKAIKGIYVESGTAVPETF